MGTSRDTIRRWLNDAKREGATHVIIVCDTFEYGDYPVSVMPGESARLKAAEFDGKHMQRLMEVYSLSMDIESQLNERRAFHYDGPPTLPPKRPEPALVPKSTPAPKKHRGRHLRLVK